MIWPLFQLLALTVAAHEVCQGPDGTSTPCARPHKAGWLMPVRNPDVDQPTAAPTLARHRPSVRTATNAGPGSTSVTSAISVVAATTQASGVSEDRAGTTSVTGDDTGSETAQAQAAPTAVVNIPSPIDDNATGIETDPREGDAAGQDTRLSTATGTDGRAVVADHPNAADQVRNTAASGSGVLSESQESPKVDYSSGLPINTTAREGEPSNSTTADHNLTMLPSMINTTTNGNAAETERLTPDSSSVSTGHAALPSTKLPIASKETSALPNPIPTKAPTKHKYNYASPDCGARIQSSSPASQHASGVLHKSRDRYMLTPCKADQHWVTIELCDEIRVEAVEVAVWEYFSGVVREVRVSAGGDEEEGEGEMEEVGMFTGRNVRGAQTFTLHRPTSFSRFLRIDFPSYYGSEYYCPVSQIKVYGMNQLEAYKWEQRQVSASSSTVAAAQGTAIAHAAFNRSNDSNTIRRGTGDMGELEKLVHAAARTARDPLPSPEDIINNSGVNASITATATADKAPRRDRSDSESIYAFITRRLADLEGNSTLVLRYIDEQTRLLRRAQEDMYAWRAQQEIQDAQRWESERMRQEDRLGRIISQLEAQRGDRLILDAKLRVLEEQLSHERRRGFAQLGVLMMVIAIGAATRSETIERLMKPLLAEASRRRRRFTFSADLGKKSGNLAEAAGGVECDQGYRTGEEKEAEAMLRSNSMGHKRTNGGTPNSSMRRRHRPDHHAPRASLPARYTPRKLARTSHLHPMHGQGAQMSDNTASTDGSPYARSPLSPLGPQL